MKKKIHDRDVDECAEKITQILKEYNCYIEFDDDLKECVIVDLDTAAFNNDF